MSRTELCSTHTQTNVIDQHWHKINDQMHLAVHVIDRIRTFAPILRIPWKIWAWSRPNKRYNNGGVYDFAKTGNDKFRMESVKYIKANPNPSIPRVWDDKYRRPLVAPGVTMPRGGYSYNYIWMTAVAVVKVRDLKTRIKFNKRTGLAKSSRHFYAIKLLSVKTSIIRRANNWIPPQIWHIISVDWHSTQGHNYYRALEETTLYQSKGGTDMRRI